MSLLPDFHTRILTRLNSDLANHRQNLESADREKHDRFSGLIAGTKAAIAVVNEEFKRVGGEDE